MNLVFFFLLINKDIGKDVKRDTEEFWQFKIASKEFYVMILRNQLLVVRNWKKSQKYFHILFFKWLNISCTKHRLIHWDITHLLLFSWNFFFSFEMLKRKNFSGHLTRAKKSLGSMIFHVREERMSKYLLCTRYFYDHCII